AGPDRDVPENVRVVGALVVAQRGRVVEQRVDVARADVRLAAAAGDATAIRITAVHAGARRVLPVGVAIRIAGVEARVPAVPGLVERVVLVALVPAAVQRADVEPGAEAGDRVASP